MNVVQFIAINAIIILYFLPTLAAFYKGNKRAFEFFMFNLVIAWTLLGWFILTTEAFNEK